LKSAGILMYRLVKKNPEFFLVHPGGPFWKNKDAGAWSIPKGEFTEEEDPLKAAMREFEEETGTRLAGDDFFPLGSTKLKSGKIVFAWALKGNIDAGKIKSNTFPLEWPPKSGKKIMVEEVDRAEWFSVEDAKEKINPAQVVFIERLTEKLDVDEQ
jgi:predicted NUDIX family NTP pyrophosphohydrolase